MRVNFGSMALRPQKIKNSSPSKNSSSMSSKSAASGATASIPRQPVEEHIVTPPAYTPSPSLIPLLLPSWTLKYDGVCQPDPEISVAGMAFQPCQADSVIRVESSNKKDPPRDMTSPLLPNKSPIGDVLSYIATFATVLPAACYLWELIRREPDQNFSVKVFAQGEWRRVTISSSQLADHDGNLFWPSTSNPVELWPVLLAKAAAVLPFIPALSLLTGFALIDYPDFSSILTGFFSKSVFELSPTRRLYNLATLKPSTFTSSYTDLSKPFRGRVELLLNVATSAAQLVLVSLDPARSIDGKSRAESDIQRVQSWTASAAVVKFITDGPYHRLMLLDPGLYQISLASLCGVTISIRSESDAAVALDTEGEAERHFAICSRGSAGQAWTRPPFNLHLSNLAGKHSGIPAPDTFAIFFQVAISLETAASILPVVSFDDERLGYLSELASESGQPICAPSGFVIDHVAPGSYLFRVFARSKHGIPPGSFSVRFLSDQAISCNLLSHVNAAKNFSDVYRTPARDLRVFKETLVMNSKEAILASIDVHLEPTDTKFIFSLDNGTPVLGIGRLAVPMVKVLPGQKIILECRLDHEQSWNSWRIRVCPGDNAQLVPSTDRRDKLESLKKQWGESDPGRHERGLQNRQAFLIDNPSMDPARFPSVCTRPVEHIDNVQEATETMANIRSDYMSSLISEINATKLFSDQEFQKYKSGIDDQVSARNHYRSRIHQYENLLFSLKATIDEADASLLLSKIESAKAVPAWKVGRSLYEAYIAFFDIHNKSIKRAIEGEDMNEIFEAAKAAEILDDQPAMDAPIYQETIDTRAQAVSLVANEAIKPLHDALSQSVHVDTIRELMSDERVQAIKQLRMVPAEFHLSLRRAQERLTTTT